MENKNKKVIIAVCIIAIILFLVFITIWGISKGKKKDTQTEQPTLNLGEVFDLEDVQNEDIPIKKSSKESASIAFFCLPPVNSSPLPNLKYSSKCSFNAYSAKASSHT